MPWNPQYQEETSKTYLHVCGPKDEGDSVTLTLSKKPDGAPDPVVTPDPLRPNRRLPGQGRNEDLECWFLFKGLKKGCYAYDVKGATCRSISFECVAAKEVEDRILSAVGIDTPEANAQVSNVSFNCSGTSSHVILSATIQVGTDITNGTVTYDGSPNDIWVVNFANLPVTGTGIIRVTNTNGDQSDPRRVMVV